jgi:UDP-GlcNAc:undecaprenyl-phosphate GlcNAc-1-phosphate transferase
VAVSSLLMLLLATILPSCLVSVVVVALVRRAAQRLGLLDKPGARKVHTTPIPLGGGLGIWAGVIATFAAGTFAVWMISGNEALAGLVPAELSKHVEGLLAKAPAVWGIIAGGTVLMLLGLADDRRGLPWQFRIAVEFAVAAFCVYFLKLRFTAYIDAPWLTGLLSVLWIVALINSFNMLDNMDGLSGGVAIIAASMLGVMLLSHGISVASSAQPQLFVAAMLFVLVGALLGFLKHNWPPAKIFMGDAGSYFVGYWIAIATLLATYAGAHGSRPHAVLAPLCVLAVPLYDMLSVIWIRLSEGRSPFQGDKRHFSHRLVDLGMSKKQAVLTIYLATATCSLGALLLPRVDIVGAGIIVLSTLCVLALVGVLESVGRKS